MANVALSYVAVLTQVWQTRSALAQKIAKKWKKDIHTYIHTYICKYFQDSVKAGATEDFFLLCVFLPYLLSLKWMLLPCGFQTTRGQCCTDRNIFNGLYIFTQL